MFNTNNPRYYWDAAHDNSLTMDGKSDARDRQREIDAGTYVYRAPDGKVYPPAPSFVPKPGR